MEPPVTREKDSDATPSAPPSAPPPSLTYDPPPPAPRGGSPRLAVVSLVLGLLAPAVVISALVAGDDVPEALQGLFVLGVPTLALAAIATGIVALRQGQPGRGYARAGIQLGLLVIISFIVILVAYALSPDQG